MELTTQMDSSTQIYEKILTTLDDSFSTRNVRTETVKSLTEQDTNNADTTIPGATSTGGRKQLECGNFLMREQGINTINTRCITIALLDPSSIHHKIENIVAFDKYNSQSKIYVLKRRIHHVWNRKIC